LSLRNDEDAAPDPADRHSAIAVSRPHLTARARGERWQGRRAAIRAKGLKIEERVSIAPYHGELTI